MKHTTIILILLGTLLYPWQAICKAKGKTAHAQPRKAERIYVEIHDNADAGGYSCYNSTEYSIADDTLTISRYAEHAGTFASNNEAALLLKKHLSASEQQRLRGYVTRFPFDSLREMYTGAQQRHCDEQRQLSVTVRLGGYAKTILLYDSYEPHMARLFALVNSLIPASRMKTAGIAYKAASFSAAR